MTTNWSHDWEYEVENYDGQQEEPESYILVSILASSGEEAAKRALTYVRANFDDGDTFTRAEFEGTVMEDTRGLDGEARHFVTLYFPFRY